MEQKPNQKEALEMLNSMNVQFTEQNLIHFTEKDDYNKVELLLIAGVNPNCAFSDSNKFIHYPIYEAVAKGNVKMLELLLSYGVNVNQRLNNEMTALLFAVVDNKKEVVKFLIEKGADVNLKNIAKLNARYYAKENKNEEILQILINAGAEEIKMEEVASIVKAGKKSGIQKIVICIAVTALIMYIYSQRSTSSNSNSGGSSSSSSASGSHTCTWCGKGYSGNGYNHLGGTGAQSYCAEATNGWEKQNQNCSMKCCEESSRGRH
jgi:hypothetical protein